MSENDVVASVDDLQFLENVLEDTPAEPRTRAWLLKRAAAGAAAAGVLGPAGTALAAGNRSSADSISKVLTVGVTAETFAVTYLTNLIKKKRGTYPQPIVEVLAGANQSEWLHYRALQKLGAKPLTTRFWIPDAAFEGNVFPLLERVEIIFINAYLIAITVFARERKPVFARYAGEIAGVEAEHRVMARVANEALNPSIPKVGYVPNNRGFEAYRIKSLDGIVQALMSLGIRFDEQGPQPGAFYDFPGSPLRTGTGYRLLVPVPA